jgi:hypothetical protein
MSAPKRRLDADDAFQELVERLRESGLAYEEIDIYLLEKLGTWSADDGLPVPPGLLARQLDLQKFLTIPPRPMDWLIRGLLARGETVNLAAKWGVGKTWFALDFALTIADQNRDCFLGRPVKHGKVIFLDEESSEDIVRERLALLGARPHVAENLVYLLQTGMKLTQPEAAVRLHQALSDVKPMLVVFDSLTRFHSGLDENSATDMAKLTEVITPLSRDFGASVVIIDHGTKSGSRDPSNAARGSGEKSAGVDRTWYLEGDENRLTLTHGKVRRGKAPPPLNFRRVSSPEADAFMADGGSWPPGRVGLWHEMLGDVDPRQGTDAHADLLAALATNGGSVPMSDLVRAVYFGNRDRANRALSDAERMGLIRREPDPKDSRAKVVVLVARQSTAA